MPGLVRVADIEDEFARAVGHRDLGKLLRLTWAAAARKELNCSYPESDDRSATGHDTHLLSCDGDGALSKGTEEASRTQVAQGRRIRIWSAQRVCYPISRW